MNRLQKLWINIIKMQLKGMELVSHRWAASKALDLFSSPQRKARPQKPPVFEQAENLNFYWQGINISAFRWNKGGKKKIQILHGYESSIVKFAHFIEGLLNENVEIIAIDAPAHGESGGKSLNLLQYIQLIHDADIRFGPIDGYIAHSFGGLAVSLFLESIPDQMHRRAVLIAPATETTSAINGFFNFLALSHKTRVAFDKLIEERTGKRPEYFSIKRAAGCFQTPILWIHDHDDHITPLSDAMKVADASWPHIQFKFTRQLGHRRIYRDKEVTAASIAFLVAD